jgi:transketolase
LARAGFVPMMHTFSVFMYRRALDQIEMSIAYPNLKVRMFGFLPGVTTPGGATHQATNDLAVMRSVPNLTVLEMGDATEVETVLPLLETIDGPAYIRMIRGEIPRLFSRREPIELNRGRVLTEGGDLTIFSSGICTEEVMRVTKVLARRGLSIEHVHVSCLKPFEDPQIRESAAKARRAIVTVENHSIIGWLGSAVSEYLAPCGIGVPLHRLGLQDQYLHGASNRYLMHEYEIDAIGIIRSFEKILGESFEVSQEEVEAEPAGEFFAEEQLEAL